MVRSRTDEWKVEASRYNEMDSRRRPMVSGKKDGYPVGNWCLTVFNHIVM